MNRLASFAFVYCSPVAVICRFPLRSRDLRYLARASKTLIVTRREGGEAGPGSL